MPSCGAQASLDEFVDNYAMWSQHEAQAWGNSACTLSLSFCYSQHCISRSVGCQVRQETGVSSWHAMHDGDGDDGDDDEREL